MKGRNMKKTKNFAKVFSTTAMLATFGALLYGCVQPENSVSSPNTPTSRPLAKKTEEDKGNAQSMMIDIQGPKTFVKYDKYVWSLNETCASQYFTVPGVDPSQYSSIEGEDGLNLSDRIAVTFSDQKCTFWQGGTLSRHNCNGTWVEVSGLPNPAPQTCWVPVPAPVDPYGRTQVTYNITLASENVKVYKGKTTYDFTLKKSDGSQKKMDLTVTLMDGNGTILQVDHPLATYEKADKKKNNCLLDLNYVGNGGSQGTMQDYLMNGSIESILESDDSKSNDDKCNKTAVFRAAPVTYTLGQGNFTLRVTGTLKNVDGSVDQDFSGSMAINMGPAPSCAP
ncbi:MAG TPA: hypothetical protein DCQ83_04035 [Fibrobacteres bacterium]|jgi:hypothetical protein|nr:hypothetical protein [Fibrobacterota bacterium]